MLTLMDGLKGRSNVVGRNNKCLCMYNLYTNDITLSYLQSLEPPTDQIPSILLSEDLEDLTEKSISESLMKMEGVFIH